MAGNTTAGSDAGDLFQRKATGLLRGWSVWDGFLYAAFSINLITLGLWIFSFGPFIPDGALIWAIILSGVYLVFQAITYASLIAVMPRAGGDYVWQSRVLGGGIGFVLAVTGWWFILWHWVPIYANILNVEVLVPLATILELDSVSGFFSGPAGLFTASMVVAILASVYISLGMRAYARIQKFCFYGGLVGLAIMLVLLLVNSNADFVGAFNSQASELYGASGNAYQQTLEAGSIEAAGPATLALGPTLLLIPMIVFFNLWSSWGATLYGEVRGASDFRKNIYAMGGALVVTSIIAVIMLALISKTFGWDFYYASANAYWSGAENAPTSVWPYPGLFAAFFFDNPILQVILVGLLSLWFFGWVGTVFLSSTRVVFATAFDRVLPEAVARTSRNGVPYVALALMLIPSIPVSYLYAFGENFATYTLDATLVIAITFLGSAIAAAVLPWRRPEIYNASPIARYNVLGIPLITVAASAFAIFLVFCLFKWLTDATYGINNGQSLIYMVGLYVVALLLYVGFRLYRSSQGMDLKMVYSEIPED
ncbi:MAG TPA: APC family permease [Rubrobacteraceae bacterium]|nr:APC family permease [Rubrobacteraceae bacterium]